MKATDLAGTLQKYVDGLGGPRSDQDDVEFSSSIPAPKDTADEVEKLLLAFVNSVVAATNAQLSGWRNVARTVGHRDGAVAIPGSNRRIRVQDGSVQHGELARPPFIAKVVEMGESAMSEARILGDVCRSRLEIKQRISSTAAGAALGPRRRTLHKFQLGLLALISVITAWGFAGIATRLNDWPNAAGSLSPNGDAPTATTWQYLLGASCLVVALGITAGFFRATRERSLLKTDGAGMEDQVRRGIEFADRDPLLRRIWSCGLAVSLAIGGLVGIGGYFRLESVSLGRMLFGLIVWLAWGAVTFLGCAYLTQVSQHWLNLLPAEIDLTDQDRARADQNTATTAVGEDFIRRVLENQHAFVVSASAAIVGDYYEFNLRRRNSTRSAALDAFALTDAEAASVELAAFAAAMPPTGRA